MTIIVGLKMCSGLDIIGKAPDDFESRENFTLENANGIIVNNNQGNISINIIPLTILDAEDRTSHRAEIRKTMYLFPYTPKQEVIATYLRHVDGVITPNEVQQRLS